MTTSEIKPKYQGIKSEFSRLKDTCYLDHVGAGLYANSQIDFITEYLKNNLLGNPHSLNLSSKYCHDAVDQIRFQILEHFNTNEEEYSIIFTSGTTAALKSVVEWFNWHAMENGSFVYLRDCHTSVLGLREIAAQQNVDVLHLEHAEAFNKFNASSVVPQQTQYCGNALFVYPAQCNFSGCKYPLAWIKKLHGGILDDFVYEKTNKRRYFQWFSLLDAASFVPTNKLDLSIYKPDFVAFSFYKMFGYPTGLGAILVKNSSEYMLSKKYYGGGTILIALSNERFHVKRPTLHEWYEDGTVNYLSIISLRHGFDAMQRLGYGIDNISKHVFLVTKYLHEKLLMLHHANGNRVIELYQDTDYSDPEVQGNVINFNLLRNNGEYIGYLEVLHVANLYKIHLRTGCFCNPGACQRHLKLKNEDILKNFFRNGHTCADNVDLIDGYPTGSIRVSFGYMSDSCDADRLIAMINECFVEQPAVIKVPDDWEEKSHILRRKFENLLQTNYCIQSKLSSDSQLDSNLTDLSLNERSVNKFKEAVLTEIFVYPVKSCGAYRVTSSWPVTRTGLMYDREWMIVSTDGVVLTQKRIPRLCLIMPDINQTEDTLTLQYVGDSGSTISIPLNCAVERENVFNICQSKVCNDRVKVTDCGNKAACWLEQCLNEPGVRLVKLLARNPKNGLEKNLSLANQAQYLLITKASVKWLMDQTRDMLDIKSDEMIRRFRSNFVISGDMSPMEEFEWKELRIGPMLFQVEGACNRCQIVCVDQSSGETNRAPLTALSNALKGRIKFGIYLKNADVNASTVLTLGDCFYILL